jgi:hypothetical protein
MTSLSPFSRNRDTLLTIGVAVRVTAVLLHKHNMIQNQYQVDHEHASRKNCLQHRLIVGR